MKLLKLGKRLCVAIATDPRKLLAFCVVAGVLCYFLDPMAWWQTTCDRAAVLPKAPLASATVPVLPVAESHRPVMATAATYYRPSWQQVAAWMASDPRMESALPLKQKRDPFEVLDIELANVKLDGDRLGIQAFPVAKNRRTTASNAQKTGGGVSTSGTPAHLTLTGIIVGPERSVAQINGRVYKVGETVLVNQARGSFPMEFRIVDIASDHVVLSSNGEQLELTFPAPEKNNRVEIENGD